MKKIQKSEYPIGWPVEFYFGKTELSGGRMRVKLLPYQYMENPTNSDALVMVKPEMNVQCNSSKRAEFPEGTVVALKNFVPNVNYYGMDKAYMEPVEYPDGTDTSSHPPVDNDPEAYSAYKEYQNFADSISSDGKEAAPPVSSEPTYFDKLKDKYPVPTIEDDGYYIEPEKWWFLIRNFEKQEPTLLLGPTGTSKTTVVKIISQKAFPNNRYKLAIHDMGAMQDPVSGLLGVHRLKDGESVFDEAPFVKDIQRPGIVLLDELSRAPSAANNILFPTLDFRRELYLAFASSDQDRIIQVNKHACFFATANLGIGYTGTTDLDEALKSRFQIAEFNYLTPEIETNLLVKVHGIAKYHAGKIADLANSLRLLYHAQELSNTISTRDTLSAASLCADGFPLRLALLTSWLPLFEGLLSDEGAEKRVVNETITKVVK